MELAYDRKTVPNVKIGKKADSVKIHAKGTLGIATAVDIAILNAEYEDDPTQQRQTCYKNACKQRNEVGARKLLASAGMNLETETFSNEETVNLLQQVSFPAFSHNCCRH